MYVAQAGLELMVHPSASLSQGLRLQIYTTTSSSRFVPLYKPVDYLFLKLGISRAYAYVVS